MCGPDLMTNNCKKPALVSSLGLSRIVIELTERLTPILSQPNCECHVESVSLCCSTMFNLILFHCSTCFSLASQHSGKSQTNFENNLEIYQHRAFNINPGPEFAKVYTVVTSINFQLPQLAYLDRTVIKERRLPNMS
jgi:hypothetical protein